LIGQNQKPGKIQIEIWILPRFLVDDRPTFEP